MSVFANCLCKESSNGIIIDEPDSLQMMPVSRHRQSSSARWSAGMGKGSWMRYIVCSYCS
jgi:hypothetical protein